MYSRPVEREQDRDRLIAFMRANPFATVITTRGGATSATHLPVLVHDRDGATVLSAHMARANPHWHDLEAGAEVLIIFQGPHAYISPAWYEEELSVPTWDYVAIHARGVARLLEADAALQHVKELISVHDPSELARFGSLPTEWVTRMLGGIVAFDVDVVSLGGRFKLSQNRSAAEQASVARQLLAQTGPAHAVGTLIEAQLTT